MEDALSSSCPVSPAGSPSGYDDGYPACNDDCVSNYNFLDDGYEAYCCELPEPC